jgi:hypothetical protein
MIELNMKNPAYGVMWRFLMAQEGHGSLDMLLSHHHIIIVVVWYSSDLRKLPVGMIMLIVIVT